MGTVLSFPLKGQLCIVGSDQGIRLQFHRVVLTLSCTVEAQAWLLLSGSSVYDGGCPCVIDGEGEDTERGEVISMDQRLVKLCIRCRLVGGRAL